ncbi:amidohydrolase [Robiginitomaculum antarcticum]|uniref:amidohydrolase n=1 Tax=Robiginitomaculum antarcticum TaxID=437507 RepID=UPI0006885A12|nr:amidohydrolase [Robiginitomaculum antarcticum]
MKTPFKLCLALTAALALSACDTSSDKTDAKNDGDAPAISYASTYKALPSRTTLITNANIYDGKGEEILGGYVLIVDGKISALGEGSIGAPEGALTVDANGAWVTPGIIDIHSHLGDYATPGVNAHSDGNEATSPITAEVSAEHGVWPQDPGFAEALAGGVTTLHILPGSANLFGGRGVTLRNISSRSVQGMKFPDAPYTLKMACGENPKRVYGGKGGPASRMGNFAHYRKNWIKAADYRQKRDDGEDYTRDLQLETLADVLDGKILVQMHCYRADEMMQVLDMAREFDYKVTTFHHAVEAYKVADKLAETGTCAAVWADWWGFKMEAYDAIRENLPYLHAAGACAMIHSDSADGIQRLNQEVAKTLADGNRAGLDISKADAWTWLSLNPAKGLGIDEEVGSLEPGKRADVVIWSRNPYSTYARATRVYLDGALVYDRASGLKPVSDFRLGQPGTDAPVLQPTTPQ